MFLLVVVCLVNYNSLADMPSLEDVTPIIDSLQGLQHLESPHYSSEVVSNILTSKKACFLWRN